ncbi:MAG: ATP synthase subunit I [Deltaproteobacteria bacterium]|nr:ATP synthase subunit I [Deltaproteobacteria bacterium]
MTGTSMDYLFAFAAGLGIGGFYFAGLWWTVRRLPGVRHPAAWVAGSFMVRAGLSLLGFYGILQGGWPMLPASLAGFILVRLAAVHRLRPGPPTPALGHHGR